MAESAERLRGLLDTPQHPDHQRAVGRHPFVVTAITDRAAGLVRVSGVVEGAGPLQGWRGPNIAVRLEFPGVPDELVGVEEASSTTSRVYTVADAEPDRRIVHIDIVRHEAPSPAMRWLGAACPGERIVVVGPRPHQVPAEGAPRVLLADSSALPAALSIVAALPRENTQVVAAVPTDELELAGEHIAKHAPGTTLTGVPADVPTPLTSACASLTLPPSASVWAAGEREDIRGVRRHCRDTMNRQRIRVFGYWKRAVTHTQLDIARLQATQQQLAAGRPVDDLDDLDIEV